MIVGSDTGRRLRAAVCVLVVVVLVSGCEDKIERTIGSMSAQSVESTYKVVDDPLLSDWVSLTGHTLLGYVPRQNIPYEFKVIETDMVNAFAAPYGHVYVTTGLLRFANSEDEIWGVMGHEIGHVAKRHGMHAIKRGFWYNLGLMILGGQNEALADIAGVGLGLLSLRYSRDNEYEADDMGRTLSYAAGYDPAGNVEFFAQLMDKYEQRRPSNIEMLFRTHPATADRIARQQSMPELSPKNAQALLETGRGYARRNRMRLAQEMLDKAAALTPDNPAVMLSLGDVQLARGQYAEAERSFETAAALRPGQEAAAGIQLAQAATTVPLSAASAQELGQVPELLADARSVAGRSQAVLSGTRSRAAAVGTKLGATVTGTHSVLDSLFGFAESNASMANATQGIVAYANAAINRAVDPVYSVETQREALLLTADRTGALTQSLVRNLGDGQTVQLAAGDVAVLRRTLGETRRVLDDVQDALSELERAEPAVREAQQHAEQATEYVGRIMRGDQSRQAVEGAQRASQLAEIRGLTAFAVTQKSGQLADRAALRSLVARINLAAIGASPQTRQCLDGLVAHYVLRAPKQVKEARDRGMGYGEAAVFLAGMRSSRTDEEQMSQVALGGRSVVDQMAAAGLSAEHSLILLRFLADAVEYETAS